MTVGTVHLDGVTAGVLLYAALALLGCRMVGMSTAGTLLVAAPGGVGWLLVHNHRAGMAAAALAVLAAFKRYGWRHVVLTCLGAVAYCSLLLHQVARHGPNLAAAFVDATYSMVMLVFAVVVSVGVYRLCSRWIDTLFGYGLAAETRRLQATAEYQKVVKDYGRQGIGKLTSRARKAVTRRGGPEPRTVEGPPPKQLAGRARDSRGRFTPGGKAAAHHAPPPQAGGYGIPAPLFKPEPWWRWR